MMDKLKQYGWHLAIAFDQLCNAILGGHADETISSRIYRHAAERKPKRYWVWAYKTINTIFFWQKNHCRGAYEQERLRRHYPAHFKI